VKKNMSYHGKPHLYPRSQTVPLSSIVFDEAEMKQALAECDKPVWVIQEDGRIGMINEGADEAAASGKYQVLAFAPPFPAQALGDEDFRQTYGTQYACYAGAMANGIASEQMVIDLGRAGLMGSFGAGGLSPARIEAAILKVKEALTGKPFAFNLLNSPNEPAIETRTVELYLKHGIQVIEASAYLVPTTNLIHYRAAGLAQAADGSIQINHRVIAKLSRKEVSKRFLAPAPADVLNKLVEEKKISAEQAKWAQLVPMADDITVEADSGGHTDNRPLVGMISAFMGQRDEFQEKYAYAVPVRIGAAGGIATPSAALAAFMMGAAYVTTGSINQACVEAGASEHTRKLLATMEMTDVAMAPAGDMFEMGTRVQVLKRGTMFAMRAQKLYELYSRYNAWEEIPAAEREKQESQVFKRDFNSIWEECVRFFSARDPRQVERGEKNPRDKMALVFRWYLGLSSRWSNSGEVGREMDYQIWTGPSMGAFNDWVRGTALAEVQNRRVVDVNLQILKGCAYLYRLRMLEMQGVHFPAGLQSYKPVG
jgi:trans-AT polyketide synthase, acyltransferase and oxidoreductase domains